MIDEAMKGNRMIGIIQPRKSGELKKPNLYDVGCTGKLQVLTKQKMEDI